MTTEITEYELNRPQSELKREKEQFELAIKFYENKELSKKQKELEQKVERINSRLRQITS